MNERIRIVDEKAQGAARDFLRKEAALLEVIQEVDELRAFEVLGYPSLFTYCVDRLKLSESYAYAFISVARKSRKVPELKVAVQEGTLTVSQAKRIVSVVEPGNATVWIRAASIQTQKDLEKTVSRALPEPESAGRIKRVGGAMSELKVVVPDRTREKLLRLMDVKGISLVEALDLALGEALDCHDPVKRAERCQKRAKQPASQKAPSLRIATRRGSIPAHVLHEVALRDQGQCTHRRTDADTCPSRRYLHLHHRIPVSRGGAHSAENLTTLCSAHHAALHKGSQGSPP